MTFTSCFAPFTEDLVEVKRKSGYGYAEWIPHKFDEFCVNRKLEEPVVTRELAQDWGTLREMKSKATWRREFPPCGSLACICSPTGSSAMFPRNSPAKAVTLHMS